jgi:hypothetical protein
MKIWMANELGQIKYYPLDSPQREDVEQSAHLETLTTEAAQNPADYVQIMTHAKWKTSNRLFVPIPHQPDYPK